MDNTGVIACGPVSSTSNPKSENDKERDATDVRSEVDGSPEAVSVSPGSEAISDCSRDALHLSDFEKSVVSRGNDGSSGSNAMAMEVIALLRSELEQALADKSAMALDIEIIKNDVRNMQIQLNELAAEVQGRIRRNNNLIIFNYSESGAETPTSLYNAMADFLRVFNISSSKIVAVERLGRNMVFCPVLLVLRSTKYVRFIMKKKRKLTSYVRWMNVRICVDLTSIHHQNMISNDENSNLSPNSDQLEE